MSYHGSSGLSSFLFRVIQTPSRNYDKSEAWDFESPELWDKEWSGEHQSAVEPQPKSMGYITAWSPYVFVAGLLVLTRLRTLNMEAFLRADHPLITWSWPAIFGSDISCIHFIYSVFSKYIKSCPISFCILFGYKFKKFPLSPNKDNFNGIIIGFLFF